jgi:WD40 repeat protein
VLHAIEVVLLVQIQNIYLSYLNCHKLSLQVEKKSVFNGHRDAVYQLVKGKLEHQFISTGGDGMVVEWDILQPETGKVIAKLQHASYAMHWCNSSELLVIAENQNGLHFLDYANKKIAFSIALGNETIFDILSVRNILWVATGSGSIYLIDVLTQKIISILQTSDKSCRTLAMIDENTIAAGFSDQLIRTFDSMGNLKSEWQAHSISVFSLAYDPETHRLWSGSRDAHLKSWNIEDQNKIDLDIVAHMYAINHIALQTQNSWLATASMDKSIKIWDRVEGRLLKVIDKARNAGHGTSVNKLLWLGHNNLLISCSDDKTISAWSIQAS